ncbi:MAG: Maf family protein [Candidatus Sulfotelmatobacter sp.]
MLVLASASPRRQELLRKAGIAFQVQAADIDETPHGNESAKDCAERLAREKALAVSATCPEDYVLGADTVVEIDDIILGKPVDGDDAARMLRMLSGRTHRVITGVCVAGPAKPFPAQPQNKLNTENRELRTASETTLVTMCGLPDDDIRAYVASGEPMDKAGAYAIQGIASRWIPRIEGDYSNVVGLPVALVWRMLREGRVL